MQHRSEGDRQRQIPCLVLQVLKSRVPATTPSLKSIFNHTPLFKISSIELGVLGQKGTFVAVAFNDVTAEGISSSFCLWSPVSHSSAINNRQFSQPEGKALSCNPEGSTQLKTGMWLIVFTSQWVC